MSAPRGVLTADKRDQLNCLTRDRSVDAVLALRARLVLWWDEGYSAAQIAEWAGVVDKTARLWPVRYAESGIDGLRGIPHPGKPRVHDERVRSRILALVLQRQFVTSSAVVAGAGAGLAGSSPV